MFWIKKEEEITSGRVMEGSRVGFFSSGVMCGLLKDDGKQPDDRDEFTRVITN